MPSPAGAVSIHRATVWDSQSKDNRNASYLWRTGKLVEQRRVAGKTKGCCGPRQLRTQRPEGSPAPKSRLPAWSLYPKTHKRFIRSCMRGEGGRGWGSTLDRYKWAERVPHIFMISILHFFLFNGSKWKLLIEISLSDFYSQIFTHFYSIGYRFLNIESTDNW